MNDGKLAKCGNEPARSYQKAKIMNDYKPAKCGNEGRALGWRAQQWAITWHSTILEIYDELEV